MKILKNAGWFEVLSTPENVIKDIATAARTCYQTQDKSTPVSDEILVKNLMKRQHFAMFEFSHLNVRFNDVCRGFTHEMVRHRLSSFAQESTRYVDESNLHCVVPPHKDETENYLYKNTAYPEVTINLEDWFDGNQRMYETLRNNGWNKEDARQVLPIATRSQIVVGANIREWRHIFKMRCDHFAHWEIRKVMIDLLKWCQKNIPIVFDDFKFFTTESGIEYARIMMHSHLISEAIQENGDVEDIISRLPVEYLLRIKKYLSEKEIGE